MSSQEDYIEKADKPDQVVRRKRRVVGNVALLACLPCRQARSRCDGKPPSVCGRCRQRGHHCTYEPSMKLQKDDILRELNQVKASSDRLVAENQNLTTILKSIIKDDHILGEIQRDEDNDSTTKWLESLSNIEPSVGLGRESGSTLDQRLNSLTLRMRTKSYDRLDGRGQWTSLTTNHDFLDKLVSLFIENVLDSCLFMNAQEFINDYLEGRPGVCSVVLLNAVCGMACNFIIGDLDRVTEQDTSFINFLRSSFVKHANDSMEAAEKQHLTTIQAMVVMYMVELADGQAQSASMYLNCAMEILETQTQEAKDYERTLRYLDMLWSMITFRIPFSNKLERSFDQDSLFPDIDQALRQFYEDTNTMSQVNTIHYITAYQAQLYQFGMSILRMYHGLGGMINLQTIRKMHDRSEYILTLAPLSASLRQKDLCMLYIIYHGIVDVFWLPLLSYACSLRHDSMVEDIRDLLLSNVRKGFGYIERLSTDPIKANLLPHYLYWIVKVCDTLCRWTGDLAEQRRSLFCCLDILSSNTSCPKLCHSLAGSILTEIGDSVSPGLVEEMKNTFRTFRPCAFRDVLAVTTRGTYIVPLTAMKSWLDPELASQWSPLYKEHGLGSRHHRSMKLSDICS